MKSRTEQLMENMRLTPTLVPLLPAAAGMSWPIPQRKDGRVFATLLFFNFAAQPGAPGKVLYPPFAAVTVAWADQRLIEYLDFSFRGPGPALPPDQPIGKFPHATLATLTMEQFIEQRNSLFTLYDELFALLAQDGQPTSVWSDRFGQLLGRYIEPALLPYYRALAPGFVNHFVPQEYQEDANAIY